METNKQAPNKGFNLSADNLKMQLISTINESSLPISVTYYILKDLLTVAESTYNKIVTEEYEEFSQKAKQFAQEQMEEEKEDVNC